MHFKSLILAIALLPVAVSAMATAAVVAPTISVTTSGNATKKKSFENILTTGYTSVSGSKNKYDVGATLNLLGKSNVTFEFVGKEAAYENVLFVFGNAKFTNHAALHTSVTFNDVAAGKLDFGFQSNGLGSIYANGSSAIGFMVDKNKTSALALFNDGYRDRDFDDMGVKISVSAAVTPVPEPESYALLLAGLGLVGAAVRRRKAQHA